MGGHHALVGRQDVEVVDEPRVPEEDRKIPGGVEPGAQRGSPQVSPGVDGGGRRPAGRLQFEGADPLDDLPAGLGQPMRRQRGPLPAVPQTNTAVPLASVPA